MCEVCNSALGRRSFLKLAGAAGLAAGLAPFAALAAGGATTHVTADEALAKLKEGNAKYVSSPQLCEAETEAIASVLGTHVQRLATIAHGGDTDTNAAICGALLGAAQGRDAIPLRWRQQVLSCRAVKGRGVTHPRPATYWGDDAMDLAEALLGIPTEWATTES